MISQWAGLYNQSDPACEPDPHFSVQEIKSNVCQHLENNSTALISPNFFQDACFGTIKHSRKTKVFITIILAFLECVNILENKILVLGFLTYSLKIMLGLKG